MLAQKKRGQTKSRDPGSGISGILISKIRDPKTRDYRDFGQNACYLAGH